LPSTREHGQHGALTERSAGASVEEMAKARRHGARGSAHSALRDATDVTSGLARVVDF
jgi:hypothetical protein